MVQTGMNFTRTQTILIGMLVLIIVGGLLYYFVFRKRRPAPQPRESGDNEAMGPGSDVERELDCDRMDFDPRCTNLFLAVKTVEKAKVESIDDALNVIMKKINLAPWLNVEVHVIEKTIQGDEIIAILYDRLANTSQEFRIKVAGGIIETVAASDKVLDPLVPGADVNGEEYSQFISPLHQNADRSRREAPGGG